MLDPNPAIRELAQLKRTWIFEKKHFVWKFTRKMPDPNPATHLPRLICIDFKKTSTFFDPFSPVALRNWRARE